MTVDDSILPKDLAVNFAKTLVARDFKHASLMTCTPNLGETTPKALKRSFDRMIPANFGHVDPIQAVEVLDEWPDKEADDILRIYVHLGGRLYAEAITVVVSRKPEGLRIRCIEWGRP